MEDTRFLWNSKATNFCHVAHELEPVGLTFPQAYNYLNAEEIIELEANYRARGAGQHCR